MALDFRSPTKRMDNRGCDEMFQPHPINPKLVHNSNKQSSQQREIKATPYHLGKILSLQLVSKASKVDELKTSFAQPPWLKLSP
jgi:hypothetical protein